VNEEGEREREQEDALVEEMLGVARGAAREYVALSFCALDTHGGALADRPRVGRGPSGGVDVTRLDLVMVD